MHITIAHIPCLLFLLFSSFEFLILINFFYYFLNFKTFFSFVRGDAGC